MTPEERAQVREAIDDAIAEVEAGLPRLEEFAKPVPPDDAVGRLSRMEAIGEKGVRDAALHAARERLKRLKNRRARIDAPDFAGCAGCGEPIPLGRLIFLPESDRCVVCADA